MPKTLKERNQMECNKRSREKYDKNNFVYQTVKFKKIEIEAINAYCEANQIAKNTLLRCAVMEYINRPSEK